MHLSVTFYFILRLFAHFHLGQENRNGREIVRDDRTTGNQINADCCVTRDVQNSFLRSHGKIFSSCSRPMVRLAFVRNAKKDRNNRRISTLLVNSLFSKRTLGDCITPFCQHFRRYEVCVNIISYLSQKSLLASLGQLNKHFTGTIFLSHFFHSTKCIGLLSLIVSLLEFLPGKHALQG